MWINWNSKAARKIKLINLHISYFGSDLDQTLYNSCMLQSDHSKNNEKEMKLTLEKVSNFLKTSQKQTHWYTWMVRN